MIRGMLDMLDGLRLLLIEASLRQVLWRMLGLLVLLVLALGAGVFWLTDHLAQLWLPQSDAWYWQLIGVLIWLLALALSLVSGVVSYIALGSIATSPWLDMLAARTESLSGKGEAPNAAPWFTQIMHSLAATVRPLISLLVLGVVALACLLVPVIGQVAATVIWGYAGIRFLNYEMLDTPATRRGWGYARRTQELGKTPWFYLGFGGTAMALMLVPVLNLFVLPAAVVALSRRYAGAGRA